MSETIRALVTILKQLNPLFHPPLSSQPFLLHHSSSSNQDPSSTNLLQLHPFFHTGGEYSLEVDWPSGTGTHGVAVYAMHSLLLGALEGGCGVGVVV